VLLVNWHAVIEHRTKLLWGDGIHPQPSGGWVYARVVRAVVVAALRHGQPHRPQPRHKARPLIGFPPHHDHLGL
jgi:hypothetical protein